MVRWDKPEEKQDHAKKEKTRAKARAVHHYIRGLPRQRDKVEREEREEEGVRTTRALKTECVCSLPSNPAVVACLRVRVLKVCATLIKEGKKRRTKKERNDTRR